jgi:FAD/FMN-containing dehydrogenase
MFGESSVSGTTAELIAERFRSRVESRGAGVEGTVMLLCNAFGGAVARIEPGATAFPHRRARFLAEVAAEWPAGRTDLDDSNRAWVRATVDGARAGFGGGSYLNYADPGMQGWRDAYWGANLARLQAIRRAIDPTGVLAGKLSA